MLKGLLIGFGVLVVVGLLFMFPGDSMNSDDMREYTLSKAYLEKNTEQYARCYNSVNYGVSGLTDVEIALMGEHLNDPRVTAETMKPVEASFMNGIKQKCDKAISDYESAYKKVETVQEKSESLKIGWRTFVFGGSDQKIPANEISQYSPERARMTLAFNDYVFTADEVKSFYKEQLGL